MTSYSLVKSYANRLGDLVTLDPNTFWNGNRSGTSYRDTPWEPKESFRAVADFYADLERHSKR